MAGTSDACSSNVHACKLTVLMLLCCPCNCRACTCMLELEHLGASAWSRQVSKTPLLFSCNGTGAYQQHRRSAVCTHAACSRDAPAPEDMCTAVVQKLLTSMFDAAALAPELPLVVCTIARCTLIKTITEVCHFCHLQLSMQRSFVLQSHWPCVQPYSARQATVKLCCMHHTCKCAVPT